MIEAAVPQRRSRRPRPQPLRVQAPLAQRLTVAFSQDAGPASVIATRSQTALLTAVSASLTGQGGLGMVAGSAGSGKTTLHRAIVDQTAQEPTRRTGAIVDPRAARADVPFLRAIAAALSLPVAGRTTLELITELGRAVAEERTRGRRAMLAIDDAHLATGAQLEVLRTLLLSPIPGGALDVLLFAEPALRDRLARKRNLANRLVLDQVIAPLDRAESLALIDQRRRLAGMRPGQAPRHTDDAIDALVRATAGNPAAMVRLAGATLIAGSQGVAPIGADAVAVARKAVTVGTPSGAVIQVQLPLDEALFAVRAGGDA